MRRLIILAAALLGVAAFNVQSALAQGGDGCSEFDMTDETRYNGFVQHTPMVLLSCQSGIFMDYGHTSGEYAGRAYLAANFNPNDNSLQGTVVDFVDGTGCGAASYEVGGEIIDGQVIVLQGTRPVRNSFNGPNGCMNTGEFEQIDRQYALVQQPDPLPVQPQSGAGSGGGTQANTGSSGGRNCGINAGTLAGGALGGFIGSQIGSGDGQLAATAGGAILGATLGTQFAC